MADRDVRSKSKNSETDIVEGDFRINNCAVYYQKLIDKFPQDKATGESPSIGQSQCSRHDEDISCLGLGQREVIKHQIHTLKYKELLQHPYSDDDAQTFTTKIISFGGNSNLVTYPNLHVTFRSINELRSLPFVPPVGLHIDGKSLQFWVQYPRAIQAHVDWTEQKILDHVSSLTNSLMKKLYKKPYFPTIMAAKRANNPFRAEILKWWSACNDHGIRPADWVYWMTMNWKGRGGKGKGLPLANVILASEKVEAENVRVAFTLNYRQLGGDCYSSPIGILYANTASALYYAIGKLHAYRAGRVSDDDVRELVRDFFPKGYDNAMKIMRRVHTECTSETLQWLSRALSGEFVWDPKNPSLI
jgi:hypothetical protein